jgi:hypothetical protein
LDKDPNLKNSIILLDIGNLLGLLNKIILAHFDFMNPVDIGKRKFLIEEEIPKTGTSPHPKTRRQ